MFCDDEEIRLVGGTQATEGRVEICLDETWGTVCDDMWTSVDAQVACRYLGFSYIGRYYTNNIYNPTVHIPPPQCIHCTNWPYIKRLVSIHTSVIECYCLQSPMPFSMKP